MLFLKLLKKIIKKKELAEIIARGDLDEVNSNNSSKDKGLNDS